MVTKLLKSSSLAVSYEYLSDEGKLLKKRQTLRFIAQDATDDDKYAIGAAVGKLLISNPKSIEDTIIFELMEV